MSNWLMSVETLRGCIQQSDVVIIDCRFSLADTEEGRALYQQGHIPGAHYLHLDNDLSGLKGKHGGRHPLPEPEVFAQCLRSLGINSDTLVVAYDANNFAMASRLWWLLRYIGHESVRILDGGFSAWCEAGQTVSAEPASINSVGNITAHPNQDMVVDINEVKTMPHRLQAALIDAREQERYLGLREPIDPIAGHINGAVNYPWGDTCDQGGFFAGVEQQQERWKKIADKEELVVYCGSGVTACVNLLALAQIGREDACLYPGSWSDWCSFMDAP